MQTIELPSTKTYPSLLLVEPDTSGSSERATALGGAPFNVTRTDSPQRVYLLKGVHDFAVAVLSDRIGFLALRASAQIVRTQWPRARILILGKAPSHFDDNLYDDSVVHTSSDTAMMALIEKILIDFSNRRGDSFSAWINRMCISPYFQKHEAIQESDPTKVTIPPKNIQYARDWPASEQLRHPVR